MGERIVEMAGQRVRIVGFDDEGQAADVADLPVPFNDHLGLRWDLVAPDRVEAHLDLEDHHMQPAGMVHGGVHCSVVEAVGSMAAVANVAADGRFGVGVNNSTDFLRPVREGRLSAVATPVHRGRTQHLWLVEITRDDGKLAARGTLRVQIVDPPPTSTSEVK